MDMIQALEASTVMWVREIIPTLKEYIAIPNQSPAFDPDWRTNGHTEAAVQLFDAWATQQPIKGLKVSRFQLDDRTPVLFMSLPATDPNLGTVLLYGHLDKQPPMEPWRDGLGPWTPVLEDDRLYGRGGADDGYAMFASLAAIRILQEQNLPHGRIVVLIEASEESGSVDLPAYIDALEGEIGTPDLVICLDSGCGDYERLWMTTSLRGVVTGDLRVDILTEGVHSGSASGIVPDSFAIVSALIGRLTDDYEGSVDVDLSELHVHIPHDRIEEARRTAVILGNHVYEDFPWVPGGEPSTHDLAELLLRQTWMPTLTVTGAEGLPTLEGAGNVLRPYTALRLSFRTPPTLDAEKAAARIKALLEESPPNGARVTFTPGHSASGWNAPSLASWLAQSVNDASLAFFGKPSMAKGEGGTIPFMGMLGAKFPEAQFLITGVLGPESNAHGPNEFLHIPTGIKLTAAVARVITDHASR